MSHSTTWQEKILIPAAETAQGEVAANAKRAGRSDLQLVESVLAGDDRAFEEIFERHKRLTASVAARYFRRPEQIEEIVQTAFTKMYVELKNFRGMHDLSMAGWLAKITANTCIDALRSSKRRPEDLACDLPDSEILWLATDAPSVEKPHIERDLAAKLLARLDAEDRVLLQLLYVDEFSVAEAAESLGWSVSKAKIRAWRAKNSLRKIVKNLL